MTAHLAIKRSIACNEIVHADDAECLRDELSLQADDSIENGDVVEFWGTTDSGEWRVHVAVR